MQDADSSARKRRKEARPAELISAALEEFALHGFAATKLEDVAKRAGVVKGLIYRYFPDKKALFLAAVRSRITPIFDEMGPVIDTYPGPTAGLLTQLFTAAHTHIISGDSRTLMRIVIAEGGNFPDLTELYYRESVAKGRVQLERIVARGIARGEVRPGAAADLPLILMAPALMAAVWHMTFDTHAPISADTFLKAHIDLVLHAIAPPARNEGQ